MFAKKHHYYCGIAEKMTRINHRNNARLNITADRSPNLQLPAVKNWTTLPNNMPLDILNVEKQDCINKL